MEMQSKSNINMEKKAEYQEKLRKTRTWVWTKMLLIHKKDVKNCIDLLRYCLEEMNQHKWEHEIN